MVKIFVSVPVYGCVNAHTMMCLQRLQASSPFPMELQYQVGDSLVARARNNLVAQFLESDCTHLLFIDSDLIFSADQIAQLVSRDKPLIGGMYPKKQRALSWVLNALDDRTPPDETGLWSVKYVGTGFMLIAREVFEKMINTYGTQISYHPDAGEKNRICYDFFSVGPYQYQDGSRRYLSEDWYFCQRWLDLGGQCFADTRVVLKHVGEFIFPLEDPFRSPGEVTVVKV